MYCTRYFRIRHKTGFDVEDISRIVAAYRRWCMNVQSRIDDWDARGMRGVPRPSYLLGDPRTSDDHRLITISIDGEPGSYGVLKLFEDGVPPELLEELRDEVLDSIEVSYENEAMGLSANDWFPARLL